jgi:NAD+ diphosphatase
MFELGFRTTARPGVPSLLVRVRGDVVAVDEAEYPHDGHFLGSLDGLPCVAVDEDGASPGTAGTAGTSTGTGTERDADPGFVALRRLWGRVDEQVWAIAGRAVQVIAWDRTHRYCGRCGEPTHPLAEERARRCPKCQLAAYPRLAPAVIVLVERSDGRILLARNANFPEPIYSCLAGFVEPGETLEETVRREVREEVGIELRDLSYFGSQPWPFPHSLMIGFFAKFASGDLRPDGQEIADAAWFSRCDLPNLPGEISIARALIETWRRRSSSP